MSHWDPQRANVVQKCWDHIGSMGSLDFLKPLKQKSQSFAKQSKVRRLRSIPISK